MSVERIALVDLLQGLRTSFEKEEVAFRHVLGAMDREEAGGHDYRSGTDFGAFAATSIETLERQVQLCLDVFEDILEHFFEEEDWQICRRPLVRVGSSDSFQEVLLQDIVVLRQRALAIGRVEQKLLAMPASEVSRILPRSARERLQAEVDEELGRLLEGS